MIDLPAIILIPAQDMGPNMLNMTRSSLGAVGQRFNRDRNGSGALEYALLISFLALAIISGATAFGSDLSSWFTTIGPIIAGWAT
jgi:pilus assembly protein Flp/PilA